ncbi:DUF4198 domain-containing protein [Steroidobacter sp. S1-65]|uniref:DUF4198 domain-containing protein n=1 Tax=Steroidobacter gossypii TaxID=2805490 RepID=A0ABS1WXM1_9GAMM|nr:DUF4198 domain-containing protein [Steroidobacter gossypii]MBM0105713.1 DUF4198 domain-containing protein [Steroidobacter gossypii]
MTNICNARALPLGALLLCFGSAQAHSPYLLPNLFDLGKRDHVTVQGSFTEEFFEPDVAMKSDDYHVLTPGGAKLALTPVYVRDLAVVEADTKEQGTYRISTGKRSGRTSKAAWVDGDWKFLSPKASAPPGAKVYDVTSVTLADVYVTRGKPSDPALAPRNAGLEYRALSHPNSLFVGSQMKFEVLFEGQPLAGHAVSVYSGGQRYSDKKAFAEVVTDEAGRFSFTPDKPGVYLAMSRHRPAPAPESPQGVSYTYSVVLEATE